MAVALSCNSDKNAKSHEGPVVQYSKQHAKALLFNALDANSGGEAFDPQ